MLTTLQATAQQLSEANKVLTTEASGVLEALWNGQQEMVIQMTNIVERLNVLEGVPEDSDESATTEDGPGDLQESQDGGGKGETHSSETGAEQGEECAEEAADAGDEGCDGTPGTGPNE